MVCQGQCSDTAGWGPLVLRRVKDALETGVRCGRKIRVMDCLRTGGAEIKGP